MTSDPLPPLKEGQKNHLYYHSINLQPADPQEQELEEFEKRPENRISVPDAGGELHALREALEG